ncbi:hypothetical protein ACE0DR_04205 [Azotobacter sp. CWF10]
MARRRDVLCLDKPVVFAQPHARTSRGVLIQSRPTAQLLIV